MKYEIIRKKGPGYDGILGPILKFEDNGKGEAVVIVDSAVTPIGKALRNPRFKVRQYLPEKPIEKIKFEDAETVGEALDVITNFVLEELPILNTLYSEEPVTYQPLPKKRGPKPKKKEVI